MSNLPVYSASEIKEMCLNFELNAFNFEVLTDLIESELHLYSQEELIILCDASMIMFTRSMLQLSLKNMR